MTGGKFLANRLIDMSMLWDIIAHRGPMKRAFRRPRAVQNDLLLRILHRNADTAFGLQHDFLSISTFDDYRKIVPVQSFDDLEPHIEDQQKNTKAKALTADNPLYYARTSGTTGRFKYLPMTQGGIRQVKLAQKILAISLWKDTRFFDGSILGMASPAIEGYFENGLPYGSSSGSAYQSLPKIVERKFATPSTAFEIRDMTAKYQVYALVVLANGDVTGVAAANPSSILKVCEIIAADGEGLVASLERKSITGLPTDAAEVAGNVMRHADVGRIRHLRQELNKTGRLDADIIWPRLSAITTWSGGSCGIALERLRRNLPSRVQIVEYGYAASEFFGAPNFDARTNICMPLLTENVYEFVRRNDWDAGREIFLGIEELEPGQEYYIFVTTQSGLYRYNINDIVRAEPGIQLCPALRFLQKGKGVTNITGEKLSEHQVITAMSATLTELDLAAKGYIALADEKASRYELYFECPESGSLDTLAARVDTMLCSLNGEYEDKRASGRLGALVVVLLRDGAMETIRSMSVASGIRESQYKPVALDYARNWSDRLPELVGGDAPTGYGTRR